MDTLLQDLRYGLRILLKSPAFTVMAVVVLALGIGATTAMFSVIDQALLAPLPYAKPHQLVHLDWRSPSRGTTVESLNARQAQFIQQNNTVFSHTALMFYAPGCNLVSGEQLQYVDQASVSTEFFGTFAAQPVLGRGFLPEDALAGPAQVAIISYALWKNRLGGDPAIVGRAIKCNGASLTVVGVLPERFSFPEEPADVWIPGRIESYLDDTGANYWMVGRLRDGVTPEQAQQEMRALSARFHTEFPKYAWDDWIGKDGAARLVPLRDWRLGDERRKTLLLFFGAVTLVLLVAVGNVAGLILARANARSRELATRRALGATRARLVRQLLTEATLLSIAGGAAGLFIASWSVGLLTSFVPQEVRDAGVRLDPAVLGFTIGVSLLAGMMAG